MKLLRQSEAQEAYELLSGICRIEDRWLALGYKQMRDLLERVCRSQVTDSGLQMTDLAARISFLSVVAELTTAEQNRLHTFRLTSNAILNHRKKPMREQLLRDVKTLAFLIRKLSEEDIPPELYALLPKIDTACPIATPTCERVRRMRVCFQYADDNYLYVVPADEVSDHLYLVRYHVPQINEEFTETCRLLWRHAQLNLLDVTIDVQGILTPSFIVLEPDYLVDISSLAACFREYGNHPGNYFLSRLQPVENALPLLLGNIVNLFLDEWIHAKADGVSYQTCMQKAFKCYPIELAACADLCDPEKERRFFADCRMHFEHIRETVNNTFHAAGYNLDRTDAVLEPSYICEALGLQGRLDYMQRDMSSFIEMKSGRADEYTIRGKVVPKENNRVQMLLYQAVLQYSMWMDHQNVKAYLFYTRYPLLYPSHHASWAMVRRAIGLRNRIVADEYSIQRHNTTGYTALKLDEINSSTLNERGLCGRLWSEWLCPSIDDFQTKLKALTDVEQSYFYTLYNFITKELYTSKSGDVDYEGSTGAASLWLSTLEEKREAGEILYDLTIKENHAADEHKAYLLLTRPCSPDTMLPNFRCGDAVVLYERNAVTDNVTNKMVFKGNIEMLGEQEVRVRLRATQQNTSVLPLDSLYAIEHDTMDTTFRLMYQGLYTYLSANQERRDLLLAQRPPTFDGSLDEQIVHSQDDFSRIALKAKAAKDYFLLVGPPGTGKTSCALKKMVETFLQEEGIHILLLSYTNRAVDEICKSLTSISPAVDFLRVGSELTCDDAYRNHLVENVLASCTRRTEVQECICNCRIVVGTVAAILGKSELFRLKHFDVAIVDEATQILEPHLLGILCARGNDGRDAVGKFVLVGDHKQLPAVVLQRAEQSAIRDDRLLSIGLVNLRDSLFERLYRTCSSDNVQVSINRSYDMLCRQGRMHPEVALFANRAFYANRLIPVGLPHQQENTEKGCRIVFYPSQPERAGTSAKVNHSEACIVAELALRIYRQQVADFDESRTLGVITPYRSQIALIKAAIAQWKIPALNRILVDTVERFQGSERDVIIYSFCVNYPYQLKFLSNLTQEGGVLIDRKLNVALTRARKQMFITGVTMLLERNPLYKSLLDLIGSR